MSGPLRNPGERERNKEEMLQFFARAAPGEEITFQTFTDNKNVAARTRPQIMHGDPIQLFERLTELNLRGAGIYWMVNRGDGKGRAAKNVQAVRHAFIDLDGGPLEPVERARVPPSLLVQSSPGKYHGYWLNVECPLENFKPMQIALAHLFGADDSVSDLPRVLRVPGFLHQKKDPFRTHVVRSEK